MRQGLLVFIFLITGIVSYSQDGRLKNALFVELIGNGGAYSLNYEYQFASKTVLRAGISFLPEAIAVPVTVGQLIGESKNFLELGIGNTLVHYGSESAHGNVVYLTGTIGYRYQQPDGKFLFRIGFTPLINIYEKEGDEVERFLPLGGISFGFRF